jgi:heme-degrading monooxygenase HmoA
MQSTLRSDPGNGCVAPPAQEKESRPRRSREADVSGRLARDRYDGCSDASLMADAMIRVLIERRVREGTGPEYERLQREVRFEALREHGYFTGETWRDLDDPHHYAVISTWRSRHDWEGWTASDARRRALERIAPLIVSERITLFEHA